MEVYTVDQSIKKLNDLLQDSIDGADATIFLKIFHEYIHLIDDFVDEEITDPEVILVTHRIALNLYSTSFYRKYQHILYGVINTIHHTWLDSVAMESSTELWAREQAETLKSIGVEMYLTVVEILGSYLERRKCSFGFRKSCFDKQNSIFQLI